MINNKIQLPYFDALLANLDQGYHAIDLAFGRHVHWGYWSHPQQASLTPEDFAQAAESLTQEVYSTTGLKDGQSVLDVGCGFGGTIASINENYSQMSLVGVNIDPRQLQRARQKVIPRNNNTIVFQEGNACELPFADKSFDVVLAVECIFHFPDRRQFFQEALRVLKPGGRLALSDFVPTQWLVPFVSFSEKPTNTGFYGYFDFRYTQKRYRELAKEIGFSVTQEKDITVNTLPTYQFLWNLKDNLQLNDFSAFSQTVTLEWISRLGLLRYLILSFEKLS